LKLIWIEKNVIILILIKQYKMPPKTKQSSGYVFILYGGIIKLGFARIGFIEDGDIETHLELFKDHYGNNLKGRYVKSSSPKEHFETLQEKFKEFTEGKYVYKIFVTNLVNSLRDVSGVKTCKTWNVYPGSEEIDDINKEKDLDNTQKTLKQNEDLNEENDENEQIKQVENEEINEEEQPIQKTKKIIKKIVVKPKQVENIEEETLTVQKPKKIIKKVS
jgi:hypothetical protein